MKSLFFHAGFAFMLAMLALVINEAAFALHSINYTNKNVMRNNRAHDNPTPLKSSSSGTSMPFQRFYLGLLAGYGSTDWGMLVTKNDDMNPLLLTNPIHADDSGIVLGALLGLMLSPNFSFELSYMHFPESKLDFVDGSIYYPVTGHDEILKTKTSLYALVLKIMVPITPRFIPFLDAGPAIITRKDLLAKQSHAGPQFGLGFMYLISTHLMGILNFQYTAGYGKSNIKPAKDYIPFLYEVSVGFATRFNL